MLTPKHEAVLATLLGMVVGVSAYGIYIAIAGVPFSGTTPRAVAVTTSTPTTPTPPDGALTLASLSFVTVELKDGRTAEVPKGWDRRELGEGETRFNGPEHDWRLRFVQRESERPPVEMIAREIRSLRSQNQFRIVVQAADTLVYTYVRSDGMPRMGITRFLSFDGGATTAVQIAVGGRPDDRDGLAAVMEKATESFTQA